ncbi:MAG: efflux RND transporter permease subunit, partial [Muribaculaceae bacterium]|nr:efflux RND transporter permease subunit [Muribaculaceae bacterium]
ARTVEREVTSRIESVLAGIKGAGSIDSKSREGGGWVALSLDRHADMDKMRFEVSTLVRHIWSQLPEEVSYPVISLRQAYSDASRPFMTLTLNAPDNPSEIMKYGEENLKPLLARIKGVAKVELSGAQPMEWKVQYDIDRLSSLGITPSDISEAIREHYQSDFLGIAPAVRNTGQEWLRVSMNSGNNEGNFNPHAITLTTKDERPLTLDKISETMHEEATPTGYFRINGLNSIYVSITADELANQLEVAKDIESKLSVLSRSISPGYTIETVYDATEEIHSELDNIYFRTVLTVAILLLFVAMASLSLRYVLLITVGLTVNLSIAVGIYYLAGIEIQLYSLAGITISLNLIIDNLIVMADHYSRHRNLGAFTAILTATFTTVGALSVVFFMDEKTRLSLQDFVAVVIINLAVSLAVALLLVPALMEKLGIHRKTTKERHSRIGGTIAIGLTRLYGNTVGFLLRFRTASIILIVLAFGIPVFMIPEKIEREGWIADKYNAVFGSLVYKEKLKPWLDMTLGGTLRLFAEKVNNGSYWDRNPGEPVVGINATLPNGATLEQMNTLIRKMESFLAEFPEIRQFQTSISSPRRASISVFFGKDHQHDGFPYRLKGEVVSKALTLGGGSWSVYGLEDMGFNNDVRENAGSYRIKMTGYNYDELYRLAETMRDTLLTHRRIKEVTLSSEFSYWKDDYSEFYLEVDREMLAKAGLTVSQLFAAMEPTFGRGVTSTAIPTERGVELIRLYSAQGESYDIFALLHQPFNAEGLTFKLSDIGRIERRQSPHEIVKKNQEYVLCLQYEYIGSPRQGERVLEKDLEKINALMPVGYRAENQKNEWKDKDGSQKYRLLLLVTAIIFFTTSILFNSLRQPLAIIFMIPISFIGVFLTFYLMRLNFDRGGFASFILLAGITVNAAIYIVSEYNGLRRRFPTADPRRLYIRAIRVKITPILLTVLSTVLGFIPFLIGTAREGFWFPLAAGTVGGLIMSLIAVLLYLPLFLLPRQRK